LLVGSEGADEPIWAVSLAPDLSAGVTGAPTSARPAPSTSDAEAPTDGLETSDVSSPCSLSNVGACATSSTGALVVLLAALVALLAAMIALRRRR